MSPCVFQVMTCYDIPPSHSASCVLSASGEGGHRHSGLSLGSGSQIRYTDLKVPLVFQNHPLLLLIFLSCLHLGYSPSEKNKKRMGCRDKGEKVEQAWTSRGLSELAGLQAVFKRR